MKHIKTITSGFSKRDIVNSGCGKCQTSCQSACKTSCTIANQTCEKMKSNWLTLTLQIFLKCFLYF